MKNLYRILVSVTILLLVTSFQGGKKTAAGTLPFYLPDDLEITLWAESPLFYNPTNMDTDLKGRIWVTEAVNYRNFNNDSTKALHHTLGDRVVILEDSDQDGKADRSKVFVQDPDLISPLGIAVIGNKVIVSCSPHLIVYTDADGDDQPDSKEILLTGFGGKDHDHALHSVVAGPDGRWHFNVGNAGPHMVTDRGGWQLRSGSLYTGGTPYNTTNSGKRVSDDGRIWVGGLQLRIEPDGKKLTVLGHGFRNSYETCVDSYGDMWQNDNDDQVVTCRVSWLMEGANAGYFSADGTRYWQADQRPGQDLFTAHWHQEDPGVLPAGDNSGSGAPTGVALNEGDALGLHYRGMLFSADAGRNLVFGYRPVLKGAGFELKGRRINFLSSLAVDNKGYVWNDAKANEDQKKWFRPSDVMMGTDGALYVADWFDPVVGGHQMQDKKGYGRIYRISPKNKTLKTPKLDLSTPEGQLEVLKNPAVNVRNSGYEALKAGGAASVPVVSRMLASANPYHQARALWLLGALGPEGIAAVKKALESKDERLAIAAFRSLRAVYTNQQLLTMVGSLAKPGAPLQREIALAVRDLPYEEKKAILLSLLRLYDGNDSYLTEALGAAMEKEAEEWYPALDSMFKNRPGKAAGGFNSAYANLLWRLHPGKALPLLAGWAGAATTPVLQRKKMMTAIAFIPSPEAVSTMLQLATSPLKDVRETAAYWLAFRKGNDWADLINWSNTGLDLALEKRKAEMKAAREKLLNEYVAFNDRKNTAVYMAKDPVGGQVLLELLKLNKLSEDLIAPIKPVLLKSPDLGIKTQAMQLFSSKTTKGIQLEEILKIEPVPAKGQLVFQNNCSSCHKVGSKGASIGPDLSSIGQKLDRRSLMQAILQPSAAIVFGYEAWTIATKEGDTYYGFVLADDNKVVLKDLAGQQHILPKSSIVSRKKQAASLMPAPESLGLSKEDVADVSAYLSSLKK